MERNDIYYVIFPDSLLRDFSFFQIILFLKMLYFSVFFSACIIFLQVLQEDNVRIMTGLHQFASKWLFFLSPFWAKQSNLNTKNISTYCVLLENTSPWMHWTSSKGNSFLCAVFQRIGFLRSLNETVLLWGLVDLPVGASLRWCHQNWHCQCDWMKMGRAIMHLMQH